MPAAYSSPRERVASALAAGGVVASIAAALVLGLRPHWQAALRPALVAVDLADPAPSPTPQTPPPPPRPSAESAPKGSPAPPGLRARASPVFAPPLVPPLVPPPPVAAAPLPDIGAATRSGASPLPGPGTGAGGIGNGDGGGGSGGNGSGGAATAPRQIRGKLSYEDLPQDLVAPGAEAGVSVRYTVTAEGAAANCRIDRTSGFPALDATACRLIEQRFRFRPAKDRAGKPVSSTVVEDHVWVRSPEGN